MRKITALLLVLLSYILVSSQTVAQSFPSTFSIIPTAPELLGHKWSYQQKLEFDVIELKKMNGMGVVLYMDSNPKTKMNYSEFVPAMFSGKNIRLYKQCKNSICRLTALLNTSIKNNGRDIWTQLWVTSKEEDIKVYVDWLTKLNFVNNPT